MKTNQTSHFRMVMPLLHPGLWRTIFTPMLHRRRGLATRASLIIALLLRTAGTPWAAEHRQTFTTPEAAVAALSVAVNAHDKDALHHLFGPAAVDLENPDQDQAARDLEFFATALNCTNRLTPDSDSRCVLEVGNDNWPFPIPLIKQDGQWFFDTDAGKAEILNRRIGRNELATLQAVRAYVEAQREYASRDRLGSGVLQYAQKIISSPGLKDGLYWPTNLDGEISPLGPVVARAETAVGKSLVNSDSAPKPFNGYYFKILTRQGKHAPGGKYDYIINGNMIAGFALVAWPADYGKSGIMTFIVNQQGRVYQKDLGSNTGKSAPAIKRYEPDSTWQLSTD